MFNAQLYLFTKLCYVYGMHIFDFFYSFMRLHLPHFFQKEINHSKLSIGEQNTTSVFGFFWGAKGRPGFGFL